MSEIERMQKEPPAEDSRGEMPSTVGQMNRYRFGETAAFSGVPRRLTVSAECRREVYACLATWWGLAAISIFIPFMNYFLAPLFFVMGAVHARKIWNTGAE